MQSSKLANGQRAVIHSLATLMLAIGAAGTQLLFQFVSQEIGKATTLALLTQTVSHATGV